MIYLLFHLRSFVGYTEQSGIVAEFSVYDLDISEIIHKFFIDFSVNKINDIFLTHNSAAENY